MDNIKIKKIQDVKVYGKKILLRVDFNVLLNGNGNVKSTYKISVAKDTIDYLFNNSASHIALLTHFGRPNGIFDENLSLKNMVNDIARIFQRKVVFVPQCVGEDVKKALNNLKQDELLLLENVRFFKEEKEDKETFAAKLCAPFDIYVNEAFGVSHRKHASVHAITRCIPSYAGLWLQKELENLRHIKYAPVQPAVAIIGGAKINTKVPMINAFSKKYKDVLVGGRTAVEARERDIKFENNVIFPIDFEYRYLDIGPKTIERFCDIIKNAKTIVWNGPMGLIEKKEYKNGTLSLIKEIADNNKAFSLIGGGESVQMVEESGLINKISFVSTGGGAMLAYLSGNEMPSIDMLLCASEKCI